MSPQRRRREGASVTTPTIFISYSHRDEVWKDRLLTQLGVLQQQSILTLWHDRRIGAGADWYQEIRQAMEAADVAVLLISADFLTSPFLLQEEVSRLLTRRQQEGLPIGPILVRPCPWKQVSWLARMQLRPLDARPLAAGNDYQIETELTAIADKHVSVRSCADARQAGTGAACRTPRTAGVSRDSSVDIARSSLAYTAMLPCTTAPQCVLR
jgi:hypothetical protein